MILSLRFKADDVFKPFDQLLKDDAYWKGYRDTLAKGLTPLFTEIFVAGVQAGAGAKLRKHKAQPDRPADASVPTAEELASISEKAIRDYVNTFTKGISDTTYDRVRTAVIGARQSGGGVEEVLTKIAPMFDAKRAESIAVTETTRLFGMGSQAMYRARGVTGWEWETANDPWVDKQECVQLQGKQFPIAVDFRPAHPRCRCWPAPVMLPETSDLSTMEMFHVTSTSTANKIERGGFLLDAGESAGGGGGNVKGIYISPDRKTIRDVYGGRGTITLEVRASGIKNTLVIEGEDYTKSQEWKDVVNSAVDNRQYSFEGKPISLEEYRVRQREGGKFTADDKLIPFPKNVGLGQAVADELHARGYDSIYRKTDGLQELVVLDPENVAIVGRSTGR